MGKRSSHKGHSNAQNAALASLLLSRKQSRKRSRDRPSSGSSSNSSSSSSQPQKKRRRGSKVDQKKESEEIKKMANFVMAKVPRIHIASMIEGAAPAVSVVQTAHWSLSGLLGALWLLTRLLPNFKFAMLKATSYKDMADSMLVRLDAVKTTKGSAYVNDIIMKLADVEAKDVDIVKLASGEGFEVQWIEEATRKQGKKIPEPPGKGQETASASAAMPEGTRPVRRPLIERESSESTDTADSRPLIPRGSADSADPVQEVRADVTEEGMANPIFEEETMILAVEEGVVNPEVVPEVRAAVNGETVQPEAAANATRVLSEEVKVRIKHARMVAEN